MLVFIPIVPTVTSDGIFPHSENEKEYKVTLTGHCMLGTYFPEPGQGYNFGFICLYRYTWPSYVLYNIEDFTKPVFIVNGTHYEHLLSDPPLTVQLYGFRGTGPGLLMYVIFCQFEFMRIPVRGYCSEICIVQR